MHHDCKISNILFDTHTHEPICPVDLDTVMPGKCFSDLGDMIRTMACSVEENSTAWQEEQNLHRALNQFILPEKLEVFFAKKLMGIRINDHLPDPEK